MTNLNGSSYLTAIPPPYMPANQLSFGSNKNKNVATGTDDKATEQFGDAQKKRTTKWTPFLTPTAFSGCNRRSMIGNTESTETEKDGNCKSLENGMLGTKKEALSASDTDKTSSEAEGTRTLNLRIDSPML